jgi:glucan-binding YG repeat protein
MHKKVKHIIAVSLVLGVVSGILPAHDFILGSTKAYASSYDDDDDDYYDEAYLKGIYLSNGNISFNKKDTDYNVNVSKDIDKIVVRATPEDDDDIVEINGSSAEENDDYEKTISLDEGNNTINIYVESDDDKLTYTLNIYRGSEVNSDLTGTATGTVSGTENFIIPGEVNKFNSWKRVDGKWKYVDGTGKFLLNQWWFDKSTGINYYLKEDGNRATGWLNNNNYWYYFNENGEMKTGWVCLDKNWYYLNQSGVMKMGWLEDSTGNWYYLDSSGAMKTGWVENSDGKWYYLDSTGKMIENSTISGYAVGDNGVLVN